MVDVTIPSLLTEEHLTQINSALDGLKVAQKHITDAKKAGIDVTKQEDAYNEAKDKLQRIKSTYFPNR